MRPFTKHIYHFSQQRFPLQHSLKPQNVARIRRSFQKQKNIWKGGLIMSFSEIDAFDISMSQIRQVVKRYTRQKPLPILVPVQSFIRISQVCYDSS